MTRKFLAHTVSAVALTCGMATAAAAQTITLNGGGSSLIAPTYDEEFTTFTNATPTVKFSYDAVGSGGGQTAFLNNDITQFNNASQQYGTIVGTTVDFGASDAFLSSTQISGYTRASTDGALIQLPMVGVAIAIPYNNAALNSGKLKLTDASLCGVMSGKINSWKTLSGSATPGTIAVIYRSDSSGTTFLLTQHLNAVCNASNSSFPAYPVPITKTFTGIFAGGTVPSNFTGASGSALVAQALVNTTNSLGYLSPDYTSIAPKSANTTTLAVASLVNATNATPYTPTVANTVLGLNNAGPGSIDATPPATQAAAANQLNWVPAIPVTKAGYPIVGYTTLDLSTCYASKTAGKDMIAFLTKHFSKSYQSILENNGFTPLANTKAAAFTTAVADTFLNNKSGYNLNVGNTTACKGKTGR